MRTRCHNPRSRGYRWYGAKGVKVCARWDRFANFLADMGEPPEGHTLDRINRNGDYEPLNCVWSSQAVQTQHTARNRLTDSMLLEARALQERGLSTRAIAAEMGVWETTLGYALRGVSWSERGCG